METAKLCASCHTLLRPSATTGRMCRSRCPPPAGTSAPTSMSLLLEPAFVATQRGSSSGSDRSTAPPPRPTLYFAQQNCSALSEADRSTLEQIGQASCCRRSAGGYAVAHQRISGQLAGEHRLPACMRGPDLAIHPHPHMSPGRDQPHRLPGAMRLPAPLVRGLPNLVKRRGGRGQGRRQSQDCRCPRLCSRRRSCCRAWLTRMVGYLLGRWQRALPLASNIPSSKARLSVFPHSHPAADASAGLLRLGRQRVRVQRGPESVPPPRRDGGSARRQRQHPVSDLPEAGGLGKGLYSEGWGGPKPRCFHWRMAWENGALIILLASNLFSGCRTFVLALCDWKDTLNTRSQCTVLLFCLQGVRVCTVRLAGHHPGQRPAVVCVGE